MESAKEASFGMVDPAIFEDLQTKIDEDSQVREELKSILSVLEKQGRRFFRRKRDTSSLECRKKRAIDSVKSSLYSGFQA